MAYLVGKITLISILVLLAQAQDTKTVPTPDPSWDDYRVKSCCPKDFIEVRNYCVQCSAPNVFDAVNQVCTPCAEGHSYNKVTKACDCTVACAAPRQLDAKNVCSCPLDNNPVVANKTQLEYDSVKNECNCPVSDNTSGKHLWNGKYCVACPTGTNYDPKEKQCYYCPEGFTRDPNTHQCTPSL